MKKLFLLFAVLCFAVGAKAMSSDEFDEASKQKATVLQQAVKNIRDRAVYSRAFPANTVNEAFKYTEYAFNYVQPDILWVTQIIETSDNPNQKMLAEMKSVLQENEKILANQNKLYAFKTIPVERDSDYSAVVNAYNAAVKDVKSFFSEQIKYLKEEIKKAEDNINKNQEPPQDNEN
ncbi:MAG: hypothetical protein LBI01_00870 [Elusimicrobium sp.]|jgi:hypothetical protein|nr:hypothetical protein [Elusimicrobium sp.]